MYEGIIQMITQLGFPVATAIALFWKVNEQDKIHRDSLKMVSDAINKNTEVLIHLVEKLNK